MSSRRWCNRTLFRVVSLSCIAARLILLIVKQRVTCVAVASVSSCAVACWVGAGATGPYFGLFHCRVLWRGWYCRLLNSVPPVLWLLQCQAVPLYVELALVQPDLSFSWFALAHCWAIVILLIVKWDIACILAVIRCCVLLNYHSDVCILSSLLLGRARIIVFLSVLVLSWYFKLCRMWDSMRMFLLLFWLFWLSRF